MKNYCKRKYFFGKSRRSLSIFMARFTAFLTLLLSVTCFFTPIAAQEKSADAVAKELANPNNSLANLTFKNQFRWYTGDLPNADH